MTVTLYSTPTCSTCTMATRRLESAGLDVNKVDLTENPDKLAELKGARNSDVLQVPLFEFDGEIHDITGLGGIIARA